MRRNENIFAVALLDHQVQKLSVSPQDNLGKICGKVGLPGFRLPKMNQM